MEIVNVTPEMARDILENHNSINRNISKPHVKALLSNMQRGTWRFNGDTIRFDKDGELIDGQHRLKALAELGKPLDLIVMRGFDKDVIKTIDQEAKQRRINDLLKIYGVANANYVAAIITRRFTIKVTAAFMNTLRGDNSSNGGLTRGNYTIDDKFNEYCEHSGFYDNVLVYARKCYRKTRLLKQSEIGGVYAYLYFDKHHSDAEIQGFFDRLCCSAGSEINVISLLREIYIRDALSRNPMVSTVKSAYLTKAWNYYIKGKDVKVLSYNRNTEGNIEFI